MDSIETWYNTELPKELEWISNEKEFLGVYDNVKSWYWDNFTKNEFTIIKEVWNRWCKEYWWSFNKTRLAILWNRIDFSIFEFRYPKLIERDKEIRKLNDTREQRRLRAIEIEQINQNNNPDNSDNHNWNQNDNADNDVFNDNFGQVIPVYGGYNQWPSDDELEQMLNLKISPYFENIKQEIFYISSFNKTPNKKYIEGFFNECADRVSALYGQDLNLEGDKLLRKELIHIFMKHYCLISDWIEKSSDNLINDVVNKIMDKDQDNCMERLANNAFDENDKTNYSVYEYKLTEEDNKNIDYLYSKLSRRYTKEYVTNQYLKYKHLEDKKNNWTILTEKENKDLKWLQELFKQTERLRKLHEIKMREASSRSEFRWKWISFSAESATWNIKDIKPVAIVESNRQISHFVYWDRPPEEYLDSEISISQEYRVQLFNKLKEQKTWDNDFVECIQYLDEYWNIDMEKVGADNIDLQSIEQNKAKIDKMIQDLAIEERMQQLWKEKINEISAKKSAMICCFRAISKFFDTVNNNWENFASEFEISDVNKDIEFDETTGEITMEWVIWPNKNHIKLYYNTTTWTLEFDNFLAYDHENKCYKIWKWNWQREAIGEAYGKKIKLPTMDQMLQQANSINLNLIDRLAPNMHLYWDIVWTVMTESIRINCFIWFMWSDMEVNKWFVEQFNEKNILKQDIINNIYSKFYSQNDIKEKLEGCLVINEWNEPEQFKLIKLISDTIDDYDSSNKLLRFRNAMNELDDILTNNHELVNDDILLKYLFADNLRDNSDVTDNSRAIIDRENQDWSRDSHNNDRVATYESEQMYENHWSRTLNYYMFLGDLLSEDKWDKRIVNIDAFEASLDTIKTRWRHLLDDKQSLLCQNYEQQKNWDFPDFSEFEASQQQTAQELHYLESDVKLGNEFGDQLEQAYA